MKKCKVFFETILFTTVDPKTVTNNKGLLNK